VSTASFKKARRVLIRPYWSLTVRDIGNCYLQKKLVLVIRKHRWCQVREKPDVHFWRRKYM